METENRKIKMAYIAGLLDGDGSFSIIKSNRVIGRSSLYSPMIQLANSNQSLIHMLKREIGGSISTRLSWIAIDGSQRKTSYGWKLVRPNSCLPFLNEIEPYLILKKERAVSLRDFIITNPFVRGSVKLSSDILIRRERSYLKMRKYNDKRDTNNKIATKRRTKTNNDPLFWSYIAGLMDTDGSFSIKKEIRKNRKSASYVPVILLSMIDSRSINFLYDNCTLGNFLVIKSKAASQGFCYRFGIYSKPDAITFLNYIIPYLTVKKEVAITLLKFCTQMSLTKLCIKGIPEYELAFREECYQRIIQINKHGIDKSPIIDLELHRKDEDDKGQAGNVQAERLNLVTP